VFVVLLGACRQQGPPLSDTLSWMAQTYNPYQNGFGGHGSSLDKCMAKCEDVGSEISTRETLTYKNCQITTTTISNRKDDHGFVETFNLRDLDPNSIIVVTNPTPGTVAQVKFGTRNNAEVLTYTGNIVGKGANSEFTIDDADYPRRFAQAFRHGVELCGGKPSTF
jgi:hypothetical protein